MAIQFKHKTEKELQEERVLPKGEYPFEVIEAVERTGKNFPNLPYIRLKFSLDLGTKKIAWYDNLVFNESFQWKVRHACEEMGILDSYESDCLEAEDFLHRSGILIIDHKQNRGTRELEAYIKDYGVRTGSKSKANTDSEYDAYSSMSNDNNAASKFDDDVPF